MKQPGNSTVTGKAFPPKFTPDVPAYHEMLLKSACDENGEFRFSQVPAGEYFVIAFLMR